MAKITLLYWCMFSAKCERSVVEDYEGASIYNFGHATLTPQILGIST